MIEIATNERIRQGIEKAHEERAKAVRDAWRWLTFRK